MDQNNDPTIGSLSSAISDFRSARNRAQLKRLLSMLTGDSTQLLSYEEVRQKLKLHNVIQRGLQDIPLDAIVGSVGRYTDFTRDFLPLRKINPERWARVKILASGLIGLPPIELYQIGNAYFVLDGNHRVSVARELGATHIQAYVTEVQSRIVLTPDVQPDDLILKAEYLSFLEHTQLDKIRPEADLSVSAPGQYQQLLEHIDMHRYFMGIDLQRDITTPEAVASWYDTVYLTVVEIIRSQGMLRNFPGRTETDLYLWIARHREQLEEQLGWQIRAEFAASDLVEQVISDKGSIINRIGNKLINIVLPDVLEAGPPPGAWRAQTQADHSGNRLFADILVPMSGDDDGWCALEQALVIAKREGANLHGLHISPDKPTNGILTANQAASHNHDAIKETFKHRCTQEGVPGEMLLSSGEISQQICFHARGADLIITNLAYPPGDQPLERINSGFHDLIQRCPRPILAAPQTVSPLNHALLAYDGSPKGREALFVATYLSSKWNIPLVVVCVLDNGNVSETTINQAREYLEDHQVQATYLQPKGPIVDSILEIAHKLDCDFLVMGGYGHNPVLEIVLGSTVDKILRAATIPLLICR